MVEEDVYCIDILTQVSASTKGLQSFALQLLEEHLRHCVAAAAVGGGPEIDEKVAEATAAIARLLRDLNPSRLPPRPFPGATGAVGWSAAGGPAAGWSGGSVGRRAAGRRVRESGG